MKTWTRKDFRVDWFSGQGAGGQHRNKHQNCCRITHLESGLVAVGQNSRSRTDNLRESFTALAHRLVDHYGLGPAAAERINHRNVVRTYHMERNVATDGDVSSPVEKALNGDIEEFILAALRGERAEKSTGRQ